MSIKLTNKEFYQIFKFKSISQVLLDKEINNLIDFIKEMNKMFKKSKGGQ